MLRRLRRRLRLSWRYEPNKRALILWPLTLVVVIPTMVGVCLHLVGRDHPADAVARPNVVAPVPPVSAALFFGDSYFNGANGVPKVSTFAYLAGTALGYETVIGGHGGTGFVTASRTDRTPDYVTQIKRGAMSTTVLDPVRLVVVEGGLNDVGKPPGAVSAAARSVLASARKAYPQARLVLLGPTAPVIDPRLPVVVRALGDAAAAEGVPFIDGSAWVTPENAPAVIGSDHTHPSEAGHRYLAGRLIAALRHLGVAAT